MAASRFPGKPLAMLAGRPMIEHVYRRAARALGPDRTFIATPDREIYDAAVAFGATAVMTSARHARATDRVAEAARELPCDIVINIQGDEPLIHPAMLDALCIAMTGEPAMACANLVNRFGRDEDFRNPDQIKVVCDRDHNVLFMSRQPIPSGAGHDGRLRQLGVIGFRRDFLEAFASLPPTPLERAESIDMLRVIEHGFKVRAIQTVHESFGVDTVEGLRAAEARLADDPMTRELFGAVGTIRR